MRDKTTVVFQRYLLRHTHPRKMASLDNSSSLAFFGSQNGAIYRVLVAAQLNQAGGKPEIAHEFFMMARDLSLQELESGLNESSVLQILATAQANLGEAEQAIENAEKAVLIETERGDRVEMPSARKTYAQILALSGQTERALDEIEQLLEVENGLSPWELNLFPQWDVLRDDPRFAEMARVEAVIGD